MSARMSLGAAAAALLELRRERGTPDLIYLAPGDPAARRIARFLQAVCSDQIVVLPPWDCLPYDRLPASREMMGERMKALRMLAQRDSQRRLILITTPEALLQRVPAGSSLQTLETRIGEPLVHEELRSFCELAGYVLDQRVDEVGEAALRGEVIDIFPAGSRCPIRLDVRHGRVTTIRPYDPLTQRTQGEIQSLILDPVVEPGPADAGPHMETLFDYLPNGRLVIDAAAERRCEAVLATIWQAYQDRINTSETKLGLPRSVPQPGLLYIEEKQWNELRASRSIRLQSKESVKPVPSFASSPRPGRLFAEFLQSQLAAGRRIVLAGASQETLERLSRRAERSTHRSPIPAADWETVLNAGKPSLLSLKADLEQGFVDAGSDIVVITAPDLLGSRMRSRDASRPGTRPLLTEATQFHFGDLVVHIGHGIGVLRSLERVDGAEGSRDVVRLGFADEATLLVPSEDIGKLWHYGSHEGAVPLDRLDTDRWLERRAEIEAALDRTARTMHAKALKRSRTLAPKLIPPQHSYERFVSRFPFWETPDQSRAIEEVLNDLASGKPMDRLVVGDVGFGKTEVALRAAAAVAFAGKQVAIAVPTTVLARQHFNAFKRRFAGLGIEVAHLSRLVGRKEAASVKRGLADGSVRVVVGTHALAGKSVAFSDAGLLVIDEEHRFGAAHKRRLRTMAEGIHVLTLTATPIPRTLQTALIGLRELSVIATPPSRRRPIRTFTMPFDPAVIGTALRREKRRGGQSFVVVPRIEEVQSTAAQLRAAASELDIRIAHGKLRAAAVDETMVAFSEGRGDVLLSTSIIESGLDVPAANTMVVRRAELFGLAELHQLRGRVGRGSLQAFCYLMTEPGTDLPESTANRLNTFRAFDRLGAGMELAARDLDARGAGDLVGEEQAGHLQLIGIGLYQELLAEAMKRVSGDQRRRISTEVQIDSPGRIPEEYVPEAEIRLNLYHRLARAFEAGDIDQLADEIADRFGPPPRPVRTLLEFAAVRTLAQSLGIVKIAAGPLAIALTFDPGSAPDRAYRNRFTQLYDGLEWKEERLVLRNSLAEPGQRLTRTLELLTALMDA